MRKRIYTHEEWLSDLAALGIDEGMPINKVLVNRHYREAAPKAHPDLNGGTNDRMVAVNVARDRLKKWIDDNKPTPFKARAETPKPPPRQEKPKAETPPPPPPPPPPEPDPEPAPEPEPAPQPEPETAKEQPRAPDPPPRPETPPRPRARRWRAPRVEWPGWRPYMPDWRDPLTRGWDRVRPRTTAGAMKYLFLMGAGIYGLAASGLELPELPVLWDTYVPQGPRIMPLQPRLDPVRQAEAPQKAVQTAAIPQATVTPPAAITPAPVKPSIAPPTMAKPDARTADILAAQARADAAAKWEAAQRNSRASIPDNYDGPIGAATDHPLHPPGTPPAKRPGKFVFYPEGLPEAWGGRIASNQGGIIDDYASPVGSAVNRPSSPGGYGQRVSPVGPRPVDQRLQGANERYQARLQQKLEVWCRRHSWADRGWRENQCDFVVP
ncbi:hypothetical protein [Methylobacterium sp. GC_Met_2]|uniref:hypothetical protein n=1 Tax=Methylobacterium sp. GC_Met_2 TaxID=2937376 RepID=UPI00226BADC1|nr:hypothetical protein [Methylobacterium sp. GC_Met_2]